MTPPAGAAQILLRLGHNASDPGTVHASFDYLEAGQLSGEHRVLASRTDLRYRDTVDQR